jgi:hypothetical protein
LLRSSEMTRRANSGGWGSWGPQIVVCRTETAACGSRHGRDAARRAHRWGRTRGRIGFHGGKIEVERPRVRGVDGREVTIPSWETAAQEDWLGRWAMNLMLINVSTRRFGRAVRLPEGDVPAPPGSGVSKSAASRRFVALSAARLADFMAADLSAILSGRRPPSSCRAPRSLPQGRTNRSSLALPQTLRPQPRSPANQPV